MYAIGLVVLLLRLTNICTAQVVSYTKYKVYTVTEEGEDVPAQSMGHPEGVSVLSEHNRYDGANNPYTVRSYLIPESEENAFRRILDIIKADYNVTVHDLGKEIEEEKKSYESHSRRSFSELAFVGETYYSYNEMTTYLNQLANVKHPVTRKPLALVEPIGHSYEGRTMYLVKISSDHNANKPVIFFEAGIHAREWTSPAAALYMMYQLVHNYTHNADVLNQIDFYIIPLSNPDGYEYSRNTDRLWRKTRSPNDGFYGVDGNRNFDFHWGEQGTSTNPASNIYIGPFPFSERETRNIRDAAKKYINRIHMFVSIHAYGPYIIFPWSYKKTKPAPQSDLMDTIAKSAAAAIKRYNGTNFVVGISSYLMYAAAGGADDYFKGVLGVDLSFTVELSSGPSGTFITPSSGILPIVAEAYEGFKVMADYASKYKKSQ